MQLGKQTRMALVYNLDDDDDDEIEKKRVE